MVERGELQCECDQFDKNEPLCYNSTLIVDQMWFKELEKPLPLKGQHRNGLPSLYRALFAYEGRIPDVCGFSV
ncbi:hypothetical protein Y032_0270g883 [Ancylostoma ceylanicum]|uniref:Uncharacterized protein n=1 Tax=Ancylostoma ceylanicum TaxID=53326 RepID=A0A016S9Q3_9BILA|nr:hypothetical protein Y032_0270g883 [Ancylostoma ceylanicum]